MVHSLLAAWIGGALSGLAGSGDGAWGIFGELGLGRALQGLG